jgi:hypothetical protein
MEDNEHMSMGEIAGDNGPCRVSMINASCEYVYHIHIYNWHQLKNVSLWHEQKPVPHLASRQKL